MTKQIKDVLFICLCLLCIVIPTITLRACSLTDTTTIDVVEEQNSVIEKQEDFIIVENTEVVIKEETNEILEEPSVYRSPYADIIDNLSEEEKTILYSIVNAEAGNQSIIGQRAVIEVIFNRILSPKFPNDLIGVLSQKGQFSTWGTKKVGNEEQILALIAVYSEEPILDTSFLYFTNGKFSFTNKNIQIEDHCFGAIDK